jgi:two-component system, LytTR family, response regulator
MSPPQPQPERLRALIVDDEALARESIRGLLQPDPAIDVAGECSGGEEAVRRIREQPPDILFLDVQMPEVDGFEVLRRISPAAIGAVIFVTAYDRYALRAFEVEALDYLLKPFDDARFHAMLERAKTRVRERWVHGLTRELVAALGTGHPQVVSTYPDRLAVRSDGRVSFIEVAEIDWIEAADYCVRIHAGGRYHLHREPMKDLESRLDPRRFFRVHRSAIVNLARIKELQPYFHGESIVVLHDGARLKLSRGRREQLHSILGIAG